MTSQCYCYQENSKIFKDYVVQSCLGQGGFEERCVPSVHNNLGKRFALKVFHGDVALKKRGVAAVMQIEVPCANRCRIPVEMLAGLGACTRWEAPAQLISGPGCPKTAFWC